MEKDMNKEADIVEETAVVNEVTDSSEKIVAVNAAEDISNETTAVNAAAEEQITDSNISHSTLPPKKTRGTAAKIVVLALCCSLVGGAAGAGGVFAVDRLLVGRNTQIVKTQDVDPAIPVVSAGNDAAQAVQEERRISLPAANLRRPPARSQRQEAAVQAARRPLRPVQHPVRRL